MSDDMKVLPWERLGIDVKIKELSEAECRDIMIRSYPNSKDYKLYVMSRCIYDFVRIIKHIRLYSSHYSVDEIVLYDDLFDLTMTVNPLLTTKFRQAGHATPQAQHCEKEDVQEERFEDVPKETILSLEERVIKRVLGQDIPVHKIVLAIQRASVGLRDPEQPIGSFLLTGPTGCGKTLLAKVLAEELIGDRKYLVRIDCSEYQQRHEISKLIGAPHGYIGYEQGGILTNAMQKTPFSIVLFDEIEKAHEKVYNLLLQVMDEGMLTSNVGEIISFKDSIVLMTSNLGVEAAKKVSQTMGFGDANVLTQERRMEAMETALRQNFRPEFLNRLDAVAHFMPLDDKDVCRDIVVLELEMLLAHLYKNKGMTVKYPPEVIEFIYNKGFDIEYGARPLKRAIRKYFANSLSQFLLTETVERGATLVAIMKDNEILFDRE